MWVCVTMTRVDEAVLQRPADVVRRQPRDGRHHVPGELPHLEGSLVLSTPPIILSPETGEYAS